MILLESNSAFHAMALNWILHARRLGIRNYLVVALDDAEYQTLVALQEPVHYDNSTR